FPAIKKAGRSLGPLFDCDSKALLAGAAGRGAAARGLTHARAAGAAARAGRAGGAGAHAAGRAGGAAARRAMLFLLVRFPLGLADLAVVVGVDLVELVAARARGAGGAAAG